MSALRDDLIGDIRRGFHAPHLSSSCPATLQHTPARTGMASPARHRVVEYKIDFTIDRIT
jgi:hypothetical protein